MTTNEENQTPTTPQGHPLKAALIVILLLAAVAGIVRMIPASKLGATTPVAPTTTTAPETTYTVPAPSPLATTEEVAPVETQGCAAAKAMLAGYLSIPDWAAYVPAARALVHAECDF
jgi:hypothetical protein